MNIIKKILLFTFLYCNITAIAQKIGSNLVNNPSFEDFYSCPLNSGEFLKCKYWWGYSADYFNFCALQGGVSVPLNFEGYQNACTSHAYAGMAIYIKSTFYLDYREAIKTRLIDSLMVKKIYCLKYYISLAESSFSQINTCILLDSIGVLFTKDSVLDNDTPIISNGIKVQNNILNLDTVNWLKITNSFIANGGEKYLTIGNFDNIINWPTGKLGATYVYVDDVSVCECSFEFSLGRDTTLCDGETLILNPNMPNAIYTWQDSSHAATYKVTKAGTYWVRAYFPDYGITTSSSINVTYDGECLKIPNIITPNNDGKNDYFVIENSDGWNIDLQVYNRWGNIVYQNNMYKNTWEGKDVADGVYYYIIKATNSTNGYEKQYKGSVTVLR